VYYTPNMRARKQLTLYARRSELNPSAWVGPRTVNPDLSFLGPRFFRAGA
jgi:hypothetical protein